MYTLSYINKKVKLLDSVIIKKSGTEETGTEGTGTKGTGTEGTGTEGTGTEGTRTQGTRTEGTGTEGTRTQGTEGTRTQETKESVLLVSTMLESTDLKPENVNDDELTELKNKYNIIISTFNIDIIIEVSLDLCSDLIYSKSELLIENEFITLLTLFNVILNKYNEGIFVINQLTNEPLQQLINKFKLLIDTSKDYTKSYNRIILAIFLFLNYEKKINIKLGDLIEEKDYKGDGYYKEAYEKNMYSYRLYNTIIIPEITQLSLDKTSTEYVDTIIESIIQNKPLTPDERSRIEQNILTFNEESKLFVTYMLSIAPK